MSPPRLSVGLRGACALAVLVLASAASCQRQEPAAEKAAEPPAAAAPATAPAAPPDAAAPAQAAPAEAPLDTELASAKAPATPAAPASSPHFDRCREVIVKEGHYTKPLNGDPQPIIDRGYESFILHGADQDFFSCEVGPDGAYTVKAAYGGRRPFVDIAHGKF